MNLRSRSTICLLLVPSFSWGRRVIEDEGGGSGGSPFFTIFLFLIFILFALVVFGGNSSSISKKKFKSTNKEQKRKKKVFKEIKSSEYKNNTKLKIDYSLCTYEWYMDAEGIKCDILHECYPEGEYKEDGHHIAIRYKGDIYHIPISLINDYEYYTRQQKLF